MTTPTDRDRPNGVLGRASFLARSPNRVTVLELLADRGRTRTQIEAAVPTSRVSVGRILASFEERGWVAADGDDYRLTRLGRLVHAAFDDLLVELDRIAHLEPLLPAIPATLDLDVRLLVDAEVDLATPSNPFALVGREASRIAEADDLRMVTGSLVPEILDGLVERVAARDGSVQVVAPRPTFEAVAQDQETSDELRTLLTAESTDCWGYPRTLSATAIRVDDAVDILLTNAHDIPIGAIRSQRQAVRSWHDRWTESLQADASPVDVSALEWPAAPDRPADPDNR